MNMRRSYAFSAIALSLSVLVGFAMPVGDSLIASTPATAVESARDAVPVDEAATAEITSSRAVTGSLDPATGPAEGGTFTTVTVDEAPAFVAVAAGDGFGLALTSDGEVATWGAGDRGQLGDGAGADSLTPVLLAADAFDGERIDAVSAGSQTAYALTDGGDE